MMMKIAGWVAFMVALLVWPLGVVQASTCTALACVTMHDTIPNFAGAPTIRSVASGAWSDPATWDAGRVPAAADVASVEAGHVVAVTDTAAVAGVVGVSGTLRFAPGGATRLEVGTLLVLPRGALEVGTRTAPATAEIVVADRALDLTDDGAGVFDPRQFGTGLLVVDGRLTMAGVPRLGFARMAVEPVRNATALTLAEPAQGWQVGDRLFLPDSQAWTTTSPAYSYAGEEATVAGLSPDGLTVTLAAPLRFTHPGGRNADDGIDFLPHVANLTRSVVVRSANPAGTRGHVLATERSDVDLHAAAFLNLGRTTTEPLNNTTFDATGKVLRMGTNHLGRYPLHIHHVYGSQPSPAGPQFTVEGVVVDDDAPANNRKWAITVHGSHYGRVAGNVVRNAAGWGIGTEDGSESYNVFERNLVARVYGKGCRDCAEGANGYWFRGPLNYVRDNVAANLMGQYLEASHGFHFWFTYLGTVCVPKFPGADMTQCHNVNGHTLPLLEFARNEAYGGSTNIGLAFWWLGSDAYIPNVVPASVVKDFRVWNYALHGVYAYPAAKVVFDGLVARGRRGALANAGEFTTGLFFSDYMMNDVRVVRADVQGVRTGIHAPYFVRGTFTVEDSYLRNATNVRVSTIGAPGASPNGATMPPKMTILRNVRFGAPLPAPVGGTQSNLWMNYTTWFGSANLVKRDAVFVFGYNGAAGDDFQAFYPEQRPDFVLPQSSGNLVGSPAAGLTNAQNWTTYGVALAGEVASGDAPRAGVIGTVRPGTADPGPAPPAIGSASVPPPPPPPPPQATLALAGLQQVYDGQPRPAYYDVTPHGLQGVTLTYDGSPAPPTAAGTYAVVATLANPSYTAAPATGTLVVHPAPLTVTAPSLTLQAGEAVVLPPATVTGFVNGETLAVATGAVACSAAVPAGSPAGVYPVTCSAGTFAAPNYTLSSFAQGTVTVLAPASAPSAIGMTEGWQRVAAPAGASLTFEVATPTPGVSYQWQRNSVNVAGATAARYTTPALARTDSGVMYRCVLTNAAGRTVTGIVVVEVQ